MRIVLNHAGGIRQLALAEKAKLDARAIGKWHRQKRCAAAWLLLAKPKRLEERNASEADLVARSAGVKVCDRLLAADDSGSAARVRRAPFPTPSGPKRGRARRVWRHSACRRSRPTISPRPASAFGEIFFGSSCGCCSSVKCARFAPLRFFTLPREKVLDEVRPLARELRQRPFLSRRTAAGNRACI